MGIINLREDLKNKRILVIGDTIIDRDIFLDAVGLSLESPTLKTNYLGEHLSLGGAANVAKILGLFGCDCTFVTALSNDGLVKSLSEDFRVSVIPITNKRDTVKTRYWIHRGDERYKYLQINDCDNKEHHQYLDFGNNYDVILVSDYRCGVVTQSIVSDVLKLPGTKIICSQMSDRGSNMDKFDGFDVAIMNEREHNACKISFPLSIVTLGSKGSKTIYGNGITVLHEGVKVNTNNTIGAGDAFCAAYVCTKNEKFANKFAAQYLSLSDRGAESIKRMIEDE
jgi:bifunctional ADP-heptose synthase (sugar kinase/adenylyltransferase)